MFSSEQPGQLDAYSAKEMGDSGLYKWLVLFASFGMLMTVGGVAYCSGVYYVVFKGNIKGPDTSIALAASLNMCLSFGLGKYCLFYSYKAFLLLLE